MLKLKSRLKFPPYMYKKKLLSSTCPINCPQKKFEMQYNNKNKNKYNNKTWVPLLAGIPTACKTLFEPDYCQFLSIVQWQQLKELAKH